MAILTYFFLTREQLSEKLIAIEDLIKEGDYDIAIAKLTELKKRYKDTISINWLLAQAYLKKNEFSMAEEEVEKIIALKKYTDDITEVMCRKLLGDIYYKDRKYDAALREYITASKLDPEDVYITLKLGEIALSNKNYRDALVYFEKYKNLNPTDTSVYYYLGLTNYHLKIYPEAEINFKKALELNSPIPEIHYYLGEIYISKEQYSEAVKEFSYSQPDEELQFKATVNMGKAYYFLNNYFETIKNFNKVLQNERLTDEEKKEIFYMLADAYEKSNDFESALKYFNILKEIDPDYNNVSDRITRLINMSKNDILTKFNSAPAEEFIELGKELCIRLGYIYKEYNLQPDNTILDIIAVNEHKKEEFILIELIRNESTIGELIMREIKEKMRDFKTNKAICLTTAEYSQSAIDFAKNNFIELYGKEDIFKIFFKKKNKEK